MMECTVVRERVTYGTRSDATRMVRAPCQRRLLASESESRARASIRFTASNPFPLHHHLFLCVNHAHATCCRTSISSSTTCACLSRNCTSPSDSSHSSTRPLSRLSSRRQRHSSHLDLSLISSHSSTTSQPRKSSITALTAFTHRHVVRRLWRLRLDQHDQ